MPQWRKNLYLLWVAILVFGASWSMVMPFTPIFLAEELGVTENAAAWAGVLGAVNSIGVVITAPIWGAVGDRFGRKLMILRAGFVMTFAYIWMSTVTGPYGLLGIRAMIGALTGFIPTATALVGTSTPQAHVGKALATIATAAPSGFIIGPLVGGLIADIFGMRGAMLAGSVMIGLATLMVLFFVNEQFTPMQRAAGSTLLSSVGEVVHYPVFAALVVTTMLSAGSIAALDPILVTYAKDLMGPGSPNWVAGLFYSLPGIAFITAAPVWARLAERWGYVRTVGMGVALAALTILPQAFVTNGWQFGILRLVQGLFMAAVNPGISALIAQIVPLTLRGRAYGLNQSAFSMGMMTGPLLGGFMATLAGDRWVFMVSMAMLTAAAFWTRLVVSPRVNQPLRQQADT